MTKWRVEIRRRGQDQYWWWVIKAGNGEIIATSEIYTRKSSAVRTARKLADSLGVVLEDGSRPRPS